MRSFLVAAGLFAATAFSAVLPDCKSDKCLDKSSAQLVATHFADLIRDFSASDATKWMTSGFVDYSSSVNTLINYGCPNGPADLDDPTFTSRASFIKGQGSQPAIPFEQLNLWYTCDTVFLRWRTTISKNATEDVTGIIAIETKYENNEWLINTVYSEFNSGAWLVDLGVFTPTCSSSKRDMSSPMLPSRMA